MYRKVVLDNGVRLVTERMPSLKSVTIGIWVNVGSRDEEQGEEGFSHFIEHMFFKGTATRSAAQISREIDALGGEMNAFTTRETTTFYVKVLDEQLQQGLALLADLFHHSRFPIKEIEKEKRVVLEEMRMVQDDPEEWVQDLHTQQMFGAHPLGRPILGKAATIKNLGRQDILGYVQRYYHPHETVVAVAGNFEQKRLLSLLDTHFGRFERPAATRRNRRPAEIHGGLQVHEKKLEQAHLCLGLKGISVEHKDRYAAALLNAVLGGNVSSRLFQEVREKRGLAYSIYSCLSAYSDGGMWSVYAGTRPSEAPTVIELVTRELARLCRNGIPRDELARAKNQMKGSVMLGLESTSSRMGKLAKDELHHGRRVSLEEVMAGIDRVSEAQVLALSRELFDQRRLSVAALGPVSRRALASAVR
ncbi:MAG TPA: pitrilysin family protein [Nitrospiraceae bacterium]|nr:pitrilysin family protein [Nitrospiraceae bacterium]